MLRLIGILDAAPAAGLAPIGLAHLHTIAYLADALAPVWDLRIVDAQLIKQREGPFSPNLQRDLDLLVGRGVVVPSDVRHIETDEGRWRLDANYSLNRRFSEPILAVVRSFADHGRQLDLTREIVFAVSGLGDLGVARAASVDAAYSDPLVDSGGVLDLGDPGSEPNPSARAAMRFGDLVASDIDLSNAEMLHLYVRALFNRMSHAA